MDFTLSFIELFFWAVYYAAPLFFLLGILIIGLGQIVCRIEKWTRFDGLFWSFVTRSEEHTSELQSH